MLCTREMKRIHTGVKGLVSWVSQTNTNREKVHVVCKQVTLGCEPGVMHTIWDQITGKPPLHTETTFSIISNISLIFFQFNLVTHTHTKY